MESLSNEERNKAFATTRKPEAVRSQHLPVRYHVEDFDVSDGPRRFLEGFAAILKYTNYRLALDHYAHVSAKCSWCTANCQVLLATGDEEDIPCHRSGLLLGVYRRHFTVSDVLRGRILGDLGLTDERMQEMAESSTTAPLADCHFECPMGGGTEAKRPSRAYGRSGSAMRALPIQFRRIKGGVNRLCVALLLDETYGTPKVLESVRCRGRMEPC
jgi:hypothetical protein